jgi:hypothetical protein
MFGATELRVPYIIASDLGDMEVYAQISQGDIGRVKAGHKAKFTVDGYPEEPPFEGEVTEINFMPVNVQGATIYPAVIKVRNRHEGESDQPKEGTKQAKGDWVLRPGMSVNVDITREIHENTWKLPSAAATLQPLDPRLITKAAQQKLDDKQKLLKDKYPDYWIPVWTMGKDKKPWPIFARVGGKDKNGKPGIKDNNSNSIEVLEWDPTMEVKPDDTRPGTYPQLIIGAPQPKKSIFEGGTPFKIS